MCYFGVFSSTTCLTVVFSCGMAPAPYFRGRTVRDHSLLFFTFVIYYIYFILTLLLFVIVCRACPSLIVAQPGGGDGFLFRPLRIPFLSVGRLWSPFATASGSVALADAHYLLCYMYICSDIVAELRLIRTRTGATPCVR